MLEFTNGMFKDLQDLDMLTLMKHFTIYQTLQKIVIKNDRELAYNQKKPFTKTPKDIMDKIIPALNNIDSIYLGSADLILKPC